MGDRRCTGGYHKRVSEDHPGKESNLCFTIQSYREIPTWEAQGSHMILNLSKVSRMVLEIFSCIIIQVIFCLAKRKDTVGDFQDRVIVILAPRRINQIRVWLGLEVLGIRQLSKAIVGSCLIAKPMVLRMREKILFQNILILGHCHKICRRVPMWLHPLKQRGDV